MISRLTAITLNTFREAVRDRVLYNLILFVLLLVASAPLFGQISIGMERLILVNVGLSSMSLFGVIIAIFIGIGLVSKEIEKKTLYKYLGLIMTLVVNTVLMTAGFYIALMFTNGLHKTDALLLVAIYFTVLQFLIVTALTVLFSTFSSPIFSAIFAFALFVIGTFAEDLKNFAAISKGAAKMLATGAAYLMPNFASLNVIAQTAHDQGVGGRLIVFNTLYALLYSASAVAAAVLIFERRNLK
jgi:ABC-type transport system involved in multi-copper enzyme maturation permease subunit